MTSRILKPQFTIGGLFAAIALVCAYLTTGLYANNVMAQSIASLVNPLLLLVAIIAWFEPGRLGQMFAAVVQSVRRFFTAHEKTSDDG